ncbi:hypothetical protein PQX77_002735 [Marasmius sp. AFHP31]|nr:hypothetical protein PQX77_002735 [Marasmius sp. AFHP31]
MAGLAPTLIIVRVAHDHSVESVQQMVSMSIQFRERATERECSTSEPRLPEDCHLDQPSGDRGIDKVERKVNGVS